MLELALVLVGIILLIGTYTDLRTTEVPDWLNYAGIAAGIGLHLIQSVVDWSWRPLLDGGIGLAAFIALGLLMYYAGQWGGGDSKMMMAVGSLLGLRFSLDHVAVAFLVNAILMGAVYGLGWMLVIAIRKRATFLPAFKRHALMRTMVTVRYAAYLVAIALIAVAVLYIPGTLRLPFLALPLLAVLLVWLASVAKAVEQCMLRWTTPDKLMEGDWIMEDVIVAGKRITGPKDLGITKEQIAQLKELSKKHHVKVLVKEGIPFVPSFLLGFGLTLLVGNPLLFLL